MSASDIHYPLVRITSAFDPLLLLLGLLDANVVNKYYWKNKDLTTENILFNIEPQRLIPRKGNLTNISYMQYILSRYNKIDIYENSFPYAYYVSNYLANSIAYQFPPR